MLDNIWINAIYWQPDTSISDQIQAPVMPDLHSRCQYTNWESRFLPRLYLSCVTLDKPLASLSFNFLTGKMRVKSGEKSTWKWFVNCTGWHHCEQQLFSHYMTILPFSYLWQENWDPDNPQMWKGTGVRSTAGNLKIK